MSLKKKLQTAFDHTSRRHGTTSPGELKGIDAQELIDLLGVGEFMKKALEPGQTKRMSPEARSRAEAIVTICTMEAGGHPYSLVTMSLQRVMNGLKQLEEERKLAEQEELVEASHSFNALLQHKLQRAS
jgi:hypothetical protein